MSTLAARIPEQITKRLREGAAAVSFAELVWAHHLRQRALTAETYSGEDEERYREFYARFEEEHGRIVDAYWCRAEASAAALTVKRVSRLRKLVGAEDAVRIHRATDWSTKDIPEIAEQLHACETLAIRVSECLQDTSQRVAMQRIHSLVAYLLGFVDGVERRSAAETKRAVDYVRRELERIHDYYVASGEKTAQLVYMGGMFAGLVPVLLIGFGVWALGWFDVSGSAVRFGFACAAAGAVGALVSVMSRLASGRLDVDYEFGKDTVRRFGLLRPWLGALLGLIMYFALKSDVLGIQLAGSGGSDNFYFFVIFAFLAGFSERFARDVLLGGMQPNSPPPGPVRASQPPPPPPPPSTAGELVDG